MIRRAVVLFFLLAACGEEPREYKESLYVFGTIVEVVIRDADEPAARSALSRIGREFQTLHKDWHAWKPEGELSELNRAFAEGRSLEVSDDMVAVLKEAKAFHDLSGGLFNPAIGGLISLWGFHADEPPSGPLPSADRIAELVMQAPGMNNVTLDGRKVFSANRAVQLDFGAFAKGSALARAVAILQDEGIQNTVVNAGGDLIVMGDHGDRPWNVGIRHPAHWGALGSVALRPGEALFTSGNYERFRESDGVRYAHIIDPRTGMPVRHIVSASVIHSDPALADAAATALSVAGPTAWRPIAEAFGLTYALLVDESGKLHGTKAMFDRVTFDGEE